MCLCNRSLLGVMNSALCLIMDDRDLFFLLQDFYFSVQNYSRTEHIVGHIPNIKKYKVQQAFLKTQNGEHQRTCAETTWLLKHSELTDK